MTRTEVKCIVEVVSLIEEKEYVDKYTFKILQCTEILKMKNKRIMGYADKGMEYKPGDVLVLKGYIERAEEARNFFGFNNRNYLKQNGIYGIIQVEKLEYLKTKKDFFYVVGKIQRSLKEKINLLYDKDYKNVIGKILFGMTNSIDEEIKIDFRDAGISHVLAISGMHIAYVVLMINFILEKFIYDIKSKNRIAFVSLIVFLIITGASPSCIRACIMTIMNLISQNIYRKNNIYISMLFAFFIIIFFNMYVVYNIGMWLSFLGTLGIVLYYPFLKSITKFKKEKKFYKVIDIVLVSISAQILIWPVILYTFNTISLTFFISNLFISIFIGPIIMIGYISIICSYFIFPLAKIFAIIEKILMKILFVIADICSKIPFSKIYIKGLNIKIMLIYYIFIFISIYFFYNKKICVLKIIVFIKKSIIKIRKNIITNKNKRVITVNKILFKKSIIKVVNIFKENNLCKSKNINKKNANKILIFITIIFVLILAIRLYYNFYKKDFQIYFVDVDQGDCCIIKTKNKSIIIDAGEGNSDKYDYGKNVVFQHLLKLGINKLDYMIFSHMDSDHARTD